MAMTESFDSSQLIFGGSKPPRYGALDDLLELATRQVHRAAATDDAHMMRELIMACRYLQRELCHLGTLLANDPRNFGN